LVLLLLLFSAAIIFGLYHRSLHAPLLYDDVAILLYFNPARELPWLGCLLPLDNGFIRPVTMLLSKLCWDLGGTNPLPYHIAAMALHGLNSVAAGLVFLSLFPARRLMAFAVTAAMAASAAAFPCVFLLSNSCDTAMALGLLIAAGCWIQWLKTFRTPWLLLACAGVVICLAGKESGVAVVGVLIMLLAASRAPDPRGWLAAGLLFAFCGAYAVLVVWLQHRAPGSYTKLGKLDLNPLRVADRLTSYTAATLFPQFYIMDPLIRSPRFREVILRLLQCLVGAGALASIFAVFRSRRFSLAGAFFLSAMFTLAPTAILGMPATARFVYAPLALMLLSLASALAVLPPLPTWRFPATAIAALWLILQMALIAKSPTSKGYYQAAHEWGNFEKEIARVSPKWPPMQYVTVYSGPQYGSQFISTAYGGAIFRTWFPGVLANFYANEIPPQGTLQYRFDGKHLTDITVKRTTQ
jgi:hypothetical protein